MRIVGLSGYAGSGKDAAAVALVEQGWERIAFADVLRDVAYAIDPFVRDNTEDEIDNVCFQRLSDVIDNYGWDWSKNNLPDVRRLLQRLGTDAGRAILGENIWVDTAFNNAQSDNIVITDVRFPNEADAIHERGGIVIRITRPGVGPRNDHVSETALDYYKFDHTVLNSGTIEELHTIIRSIVNE